MYSVFNVSVKEKVGTVRFSPEMWNKIEERAKVSKLSKAEVVRRCVKYGLSEDNIVIPLNRDERRFLEEICESTGVLPSEAAKMVFLAFNVLMHSSLARVIKPIDEILEELKIERRGEEEGDP